LRLDEAQHEFSRDGRVNGAASSAQHLKPRRHCVRISGGHHRFAPRPWRRKWIEAGASREGESKEKRAGAAAEKQSHGPYLHAHAILTNLPQRHLLTGLALVHNAAMARPGERNSLTDVEGLSVGCAEDQGVRTGVTVIVPDRRAVCAVDVRGGGPGTRETDALAAENLVDAIDALVLAGGSVYGLGAADGVTAAMGAEGRGFALIDMPGVPRSPVIPAAILYDLANGGDKAWGGAPPYAALGKQAYSARSREVKLGNAGAGFGARAGMLKGGQGAASIVTDDGFTVAALACVNCWGSTTMPGSRAFWAHPFEVDGEFGGVKPAPDLSVGAEDWSGAKFNPQPRANTTIACVAVDAALTPAEAKRVAQMASAGLARAIRPVFAPFDGDVVFALATAAKSAPEPRALVVARFGALAADCLTRAVARGVFAAETLGDAQSWRDWRG
jgi:L-aminopeptidase/D-esterase-like protein